MGCEMVGLLSSAQMRAIEAAAIASGAVTGLELMERAGQGVVEAIFAEWPELETGLKKAIVLCGPGNNGGDGFVVARLLKERGWEVDVTHYTGGRDATSDAAVMLARWRDVGGEVWPLGLPVENETFERLEAFGGKRHRGQPVLVIDALFGIGLTRPIMGDWHWEGLTALTVEIDDMWIKGSRDAYFDGAETRFVAIDMPSGLCADSGRVLRTREEGEQDDFETDPRFDGVMAELTVTFHAKKLGHLLAEGPGMCGKLRVVDIGLPHDQTVRRERVEEVEAPHGYALGKLKGHKFDHGHGLLLSGGAGRGGAARLAARGALRVGAGLVTLGCPGEALAENAARLDAVMLRVVEDGAALQAVLEDGRINALCLGPGLGTGAREAGLVAAALGMPVLGLTPDPAGGRDVWEGGGSGAGPGRGLVLDADALTILSRDVALFGALHQRCVLTPHGGEFARLFPDIAAKLEGLAVTGPAYSKVDATREAAARAGCVVLFKGADTVIAAPDGRCAVNAAAYERAAPWLATAGSGDVLAGFIAGLMARGFSAFDAACTGAWLHVECARDFGPGLIAEDLPEMLPAVFRRLGV